MIETAKLYRNDQNHGDPKPGHQISQAFPIVKWNQPPAHAFDHATIGPRLERSVRRHEPVDGYLGACRLGRDMRRDRRL